MKFHLFDMEIDLAAWYKLSALWVMGLIGNLTLSGFILFLTLILTAMQTYRTFLEIRKLRASVKEGEKEI